MHRYHSLSTARVATLAAALVAGLAVTACNSTREAAVAREDLATTARQAKLVAPPAPPAPVMYAPQAMARSIVADASHWYRPPVAAPTNTENYADFDDNPVHRASDQPVSTFSIDVDTGSYANVRRMLVDGVRPPADAVRAEEFINYFDHGHPAPTSREVPFRVSTELAPAPWNAGRQLLMIGIKGYDVPRQALPPANLVLLVDTSGSMHSADKLPLLKRAMGMLVRQLRPQDTISIVVYAGSAGLVLPPTPGDRQGEILAALGQLQAGGSTNGGAGIQLAYDMARQGYVDGGVNRILLATDGDFNVGTVDQGALETLVADQRRSGIALTTLGFGSGNYNDALAERLADLGNGNHAYIDSALEARRVLVEAMGSTLLTIASDVKIQVEFNPALVAEYRLIGYENRVLRNEDFANDKVDAGEIGAGHEVTALYEITPVDSGETRLPPLRYGADQPRATKSDEVAHLRLRYKQPGSDHSRLVETPILHSDLRPRASDSLRFTAAVAGFADALRGGARTDGWGWDGILAAGRPTGSDRVDPRRAEFVDLVEQARLLVDGKDDSNGERSDDRDAGALVSD
ncbi:YfbK domain-containing protein [Lysobacter sp. F6437]|uniref:YfbK domain-containing protein n=1 Tax=Lysobacter sp. F6437 TaxID=3459296 RepID=UPI00403DEB3A